MPPWWCKGRQWPGRGPWSWLPPWRRPGWMFRGRGMCWQLLRGALSREDELKLLEEYRKHLEQELARVEQRIKELQSQRQTQG